MSYVVVVMEIIASLHGGVVICYKCFQAEVAVATFVNPDSQGEGCVRLHALGTAIKIDWTLVAAWFFS